MIKTKLITARKKLYTQEKMANLLHMSQSQYHRREKGDVKISDEEWERIAKVQIGRASCRERVSSPV